MCSETLEKLAIPVLNLDVNHNSSRNCKLPEEGSTNEESSGGDGASALCVMSPAYCGNPLRDSSPQPPGDAEDEGIGATGHSDQSASEDSSLTDSDRTLVGDVPDDGVPPLSSSSSSPPGSDRHIVSSPEEANTNTYHSFTKVSL
jgi:ubiquitin carboxyl-terminal hydrolase 47